MASAPPGDSPNQLPPSSGYYPHPMGPPVGFGAMQQQSAPGQYPGQSQPSGYPGQHGCNPNQQQMPQGYPGPPHMGQGYPGPQPMGQGYPQLGYGGQLGGGYPGQHVPQGYAAGQQVGSPSAHVSAVGLGTHVCIEFDCATCLPYVFCIRTVLR